MAHAAQTANRSSVRVWIIEFSFPAGLTQRNIDSWRSRPEHGSSLTLNNRLTASVAEARSFRTCETNPGVPPFPKAPARARKMPGEPILWIPMTNRNDFCGGRRGYHHGRLKDALIEAARSLVAERGPAGFTLSEAAKRVGVTAAAPYRHFADRNDLMSELARRGFESFSQRLEQAWDNGQPDATTAFRRMGEAYLAFAREEPGLYSAMFGNVQALHAPSSGAAADRALAMIHYACAAVLRQYGAPDAGARDLALQVWAFSHGVAQLVLAGHFSGHGVDSAAIMSTGASNIVEMAVRKAVAAA